ncbi:MAG: PAS domain-containing sensor histidine kinase [Nitrosomonadales bacterium]
MKKLIVDTQASVLGAVGSARETSERKLYEDKMQLENEEQLLLHSNILKSLVEGIFLIRSIDGVIVFTNPQFDSMFGYGSGELLGKHVSIVNASSEKSPEEVANAIIRELKKEGVWNGEVHNLKKDGTDFWCHVSVSRFEHSQFGEVWVSVHQDMTERKQMERQLRDLTAHLHAVREEEKARVSREMHDDMGGTLAAIKMDAYWLAANLGKEMQKSQERINSMIVQLDTVVHAMRRIITNLRPTLLDDLGLMAALKWQAAGFQKRTGIECQFVSPEDQDLEDKLGEDQLINLFRISQETMTNIVRHSGATRVEIDLHQEVNEIVMSISDNGCGLKEGYTIPSTSYGIRGMHERVVHLGGNIKFDSPPGGGLRVVVRLPLPASAKGFLN